MRDQEIRIAAIVSLDAVDVNGVASRLAIELAQSPGDSSPTIALVPTRGSLGCRKLLCINARFDQRKAEPWPGAAESGAIVIKGTDKARNDWTSLLRMSSDVIVEVDVVGLGPRQFTFHVAGFKWP